MDKLNIGITCYPVPGGSGIVATELGIKLAERGHQVHFIAYDLPFRLDIYRSNLYFHQVETLSYSLFKYPPYTLTLAAKMAEVACEWKLDVLHVHYAIPHATCAFLANQLVTCRKPKIITTLHGTDITLVGADKSFYDITRFSIMASDGVTAVSKYLAEETCQEFTIPQEKIEVIPNFVDTTRFKPSTEACKRSDYARPDEKILCHISNFRPVKRAMDVVDIFNRVQQRIPSRLLLIGEGPDTLLVRRAVKKLHLEDKIQFLGNLSKVEDILPVVDLFLGPSEEEAFGLAALEALACGVPVIASEGTGLVEVVDHGHDGYLYPIGDTWSMANAAVSLLQDTDKLNEFKKHASVKAHRDFNSDRIVDQYERHYKNVLAGKPTLPEASEVSKQP
jgi:N-acetyl-alpha-D-glucosaminyl L-malate synthase BshA